MQTETAEAVDKAIAKHLRIYVLQNSHGRVADVPALKCIHAVAARRNKHLAELESDYRWVLVGEA